MRTFNFVKSSLVFAVALIAFCASTLTATQAKAEIVVGVGIGAPPICSYGYYGYAPYACAPAGYYGASYFHNGIFLGVGPWAGWGYAHGWGGYRGDHDGWARGYRDGDHDRWGDRDRWGGRDRDDFHGNRDGRSGYRADAHNGGAAHYGGKGR